MKRNLVISANSLNIAQTCWKKYAYEKIDGYVPNHKGHSLEAGDLIHQGLKVYYRGKQEKRSPHEQLVEAGCARIRQSAADMTIELEEVDNVIFQFKEYCKFYQYEIWEPLAVEEPFSKVLYDGKDLRILYEGITDLVAKDIQHDRVLVVDHKSGERNSTPSSLANQFTGYAWAFGVNWVVVNRIGFQKTLSPQERFKRYIIEYKPEQLEEWVEDTISFAHEIVMHLDHDYWPMNRSGCDKFNGCIFRHVCGTYPSNRAYMLRAHFSLRDSISVYEKDNADEQPQNA